MPSLAFLPWVTIEEEAVVGQFRFVPVELHRSSPLPADVKRILSAYTDAFGFPLHSATLVQIVGNDLTADMEPADIEEIFRAAEALAFAGLAGRRFFTHARYWNRDNLRCIVQQFQSVAQAVAIRTRRRDGYTLQGLSDQYTFRAEHHIAPTSKCAALLPCRFVSIRC